MVKSKTETIEVEAERRREGIRLRKHHNVALQAQLSIIFVPIVTVGQKVNFVNKMRFNKLS